MPRSDRRRAGGAALAVLVAAFLAGPGPVEAAPGPAELDTVRQECITAARDARQREQVIAALERTIGLFGRDVEARQRGLDESRAEQARLLGTLAHLARDPPERPAYALPAAIDRIRGEMLLEGTLPGLRAEARALVGEIERIAVLRRQIGERKAELASARDAREEDRARLAKLIDQRLDLTGRILPDDSGIAARIAKLAHEAIDIGDLIKRAEAVTERRDKEILTHARAGLPKEKANALTADAADPTLPHLLHAFDPPQSGLLMPVAGRIARGLDKSMAAGATPNQGLSVAALPGAVAVAPFDGRVIYAGPFRNFGLVLIIRHGGLYHSLLAGLERIDVKADHWVLMGEPVGAAPEGSGGTPYFELRRDGRTVDPQPWLIEGVAGRNEPDGDRKVCE